ncbi:hypothetical protein AB0F43_18215 [Kribbella sp. NPDC023972]|uniref:hypothetical protein n=1 Tax=Kribbella sp. NPDC023972 TaxID=3154795 RepID=UPI0033D46385
MVTETKRWWALALLCLSGFMIILDASIVLVAVPSIERELTSSRPVVCSGCPAGTR